MRARGRESAGGSDRDRRRARIEPHHEREYPREARATIDRLTRRGGPAYVDLSAADVGALIDAALATTGRRVVDSVRVALLDDELRLRGSRDLSGIPRNALGPFSGALGQREPLVIGGPLAA